MFEKAQMWQARYALKQSREVNAAAEWLFSNAESVPEEKAEPDLEKVRKRDHTYNWTIDIR